MKINDTCGDLANGTGGLMTPKKVLFLRYPGGKGRMLDFLIPQLASSILKAQIALSNHL
jgi:hypothetical protein